MVTHSTLLAGKSHRQRNLAGYSPWGCRVRLRTYTFAFVEICAKETMTNKAKMCSVTQSCLTLLPFGLEPSKLLCPWDFPGKNTGVGIHFLLQGIFPIQGSSLCLLHWQANSLLLSQMGSTCLSCPPLLGFWASVFLVHPELLNCSSELLLLPSLSVSPPGV